MIQTKPKAPQVVTNALPSQQELLACGCTNCLAVSDLRAEILRALMKFKDVNDEGRVLPEIRNVTARLETIAAAATIVAANDGVGTRTDRISIPLGDGETIEANVTIEIISCP